MFSLTRSVRGPSWAVTLLSGFLFHGAVGDPPAETDSPPLRELHVNEPLALRLGAGDPLLEGRGSAAKVVTKATHRGTVFIFAESAEVDLFLRVESAEGVLVVEDDNGGGGTTPFVTCSVEPNQRLFVTVAAAEPGAEGSLKLEMREAPESEGTLAAAQNAGSSLERVKAAKAKGELSAARELLERTLESLLEAPAASGSASVTGALWALGFEAYGLGMVEPATQAWRHVLTFREAHFPPDHQHLLWARLNLAQALKALGKGADARVLEEKVVEALARTEAEDHPDLIMARLNLAGSLADIGDHVRSKSILERLIEVLGRTRPEDDPILQKVRQNLASDLDVLGEDARARALYEQVLEVLKRTHPADHPDLQALRCNLALLLTEHQEFARARTLQERALEVRVRTLPPGHPLVLGTRDAVVKSALALGDYSDARALQEENLAWLERLLPPNHAQIQSARGQLATILHALGDVRGAVELWEKVLEVRVRALPEDHLEVQLARVNLANVIKDLGELQRARELEEAALQVMTKVLPADHPNLVGAWNNLANTLFALGDLQAAKKLQERVVAARTRELPEDHLTLQAARSNLAGTLYRLGELEEARVLQEQVLESLRRTLPEDHPRLAGAKTNLALTMGESGDLELATELQEEVLESYSRSLPDHHPKVLAARENLATTLLSRGHLRRAQSQIESVFEVRLRTLPNDHPDLQGTRLNLARIVKERGELSVAKALEEQALEVLTRTLPDDHASVQAARHNLANTLLDIGDVAGAHALARQALEGRTRVLPDDHPDVLGVLTTLASVKGRLGDHAGAKELEEKIMEIQERALPADHPDLQRTKMNLAGTLAQLGELTSARRLAKEALEVFTRTYPPDHPLPQAAKMNWALIEKAFGNLEKASGLLEEVLVVERRIFPPAHPQLQATRSNLVVTARALGDWARAVPVAREVAKETVETLSILGPSTTSREQDGLVASQWWTLRTVLTLEADRPTRELDPESFEMVEAARGAGAIRARFSRGVSGDETIDRLRGEIAQAAAEVARHAGDSAGRLSEAVRRRETLERQLLEHLVQVDRVALLPKNDAESIAAELRAGQVAIGYWVYGKTEFDVEARKQLLRGDHYLAFVLRRDQPLQRIELGPAARIDEAVAAWRNALGAPVVRGVTSSEANPREREHRTGTVVRELLFDPLQEALGEAREIVVAPVDAGHLVPFDAPPLDEGVVGDRYRVSVRATLKELTIRDGRTLAEDRLLVVGGIDYDRPPQVLSEIVGTPEAESSAQPRADEKSPPLELANHASAETTDTATLRGAPVEVLRSHHEWTFEPIPATRSEARVIATYWDDLVDHGESENRSEAMLLSGRRASRPAFEVLAPKSRWIHLATHGYFAPESVASWADTPPGSEPGSWNAAKSDVVGLAPMVLAGLAFAGANGAPDLLGRVAGVMTAEEIASLDLSGCELAVLSACQTNVGVHRGGRGIASLQQALMASGVRTAVTSLWQVPDEATRDLMVDFYRRLWIQGKPKSQALWEAKQKLRRKRDADGNPVYGTRDWAGWVLSGDSE